MILGVQENRDVVELQGESIPMVVLLKLKKNMSYKLKKGHTQISYKTSILVWSLNMDSINKNGCDKNQDDKMDHWSDKIRNK